MPPEVKEIADKVEKVTFNWAKLIARIYEVNPLICSNCGKEIKIIAFVTHSSQIWRILRGIGWPTEVPEFDPEYEIVSWHICQHVPETEDGFPEIESQLHPEAGPDPPRHDCTLVEPPRCIRVSCRHSKWCGCRPNREHGEV